MRYVNAQDILPEDVLALLQQYADGAYVYIPKKTRKSWGENTYSKAETSKRNANIYAQYKSGKKIGDLAILHFLSEKSIERIITLGRKQDKQELNE